MKKLNRDKYNVLLGPKSPLCEYRTEICQCLSWKTALEGVFDLKAYKIQQCKSC